MSKPFQGLKFCSTSVPSELRSEVSQKIKSMGGIHVNNLMSDVNYLIVGTNDLATLYSDKYKFCVKKRDDIGFLLPEAVFKIHESWLNNHDDSINIENYEMKFAQQLNVCMSRISIDDKVRQYMDRKGIHDVGQFRNYIIDLLKKYGAEVTESLTNTSSVVITNEKSGKRYEVAKKWNIPTIHPLWVIDSHRRKVPVELLYYEFDKLPLEKIGVGCCEVWNKLDNVRKRKKTEEQDEELVIKKRDPKLWSSIMVEQKRKDQKRQADEWEEPQLEQLRIPKINNSRLLSAREVKSSLFLHKKFYLKYFTMSQSKILKRVIESHNGAVIDNVDDSDPLILKDLNFVIIPSDFELTLIPSHFQEYDNLQILTEWFIERSLHYSKLTIDQWGLPFNKSLTHSQLPDNTLKINLTGFQGIELLHLNKIVKNFMNPGFELVDSLNKNVDLLVVNIEILKLPERNKFLFDHVSHLKAPTSDKSNISTTSVNSTKTKMKFAKQNNIPIVTIGFILEFFLKKDDSSPIFINQKEWCMFCPKLDRVNARVSSIVRHNDKQSKLPPREESMPKLPSPIRNKRANAPERIYGRAPVSQLNSMVGSIAAPKNDNPFEDEDDDGGDVRATQISYGNDNENEKLLCLLKGEKYKETKTSEDSRGLRTTRGKFKEMMGINRDI